MGRGLQRLGFAVLIAGMVVWSLFPLWYAVVASLSRDTELFQPHYWPPSLYLGNFADLFSRSRLPRGVFNSVVVGVGAVALTLTLGVLAAYALARFVFPGRRLVLFAILSAVLFPQVAVLAGFFELVTRLGIYNNLISVVLGDFVLLAPFTVWMLTAYLRALPRELEDMAIIDGARPLQILLKVLLPLLMPGMVATGLLTFILAWNEFLFAFTFTLTEERRTAPVALAVLGGQTPHDSPWGSLMAACVILTAPSVALVLLFQRKIVAGLTAGEVTD